MAGKSMVRAYPISRSIRAIVVVPDFQLATYDPTPVYIYTYIYIYIYYR